MANPVVTRSLFLLTLTTAAACAGEVGPGVDMTPPTYAYAAGAGGADAVDAVDVVDAAAAGAGGVGAAGAPAVPVGGAAGVEAVDAAAGAGGVGGEDPDAAAGAGGVGGVGGEDPAPVGGAGGAAGADAAAGAGGVDAAAGAGGAGGVAGAAGAAAASDGRFCKINPGELWAGQRVGCDSELYPTSNVFYSIETAPNRFMVYHCNTADRPACPAGSPCRWDRGDGSDTQLGTCE